MLRVLYLIHFAGKAGTERYVQTLIQKLGGTAIRPFLGYTVEGPLVAAAKAGGAEIFHLPMRAPFDLIAAFRLARFCRRNQIDVVHAQFLRECYIALFARILYPKLRVVYTMHFVMENHGLLRLCNRIMTRKIHGMISVCRIGAAVLAQNGNPKSRITVINNGVDLALWQKSADDGGLKAQLGIDAQTKLLLCSSRFAADKGHAFLLDAIALLKEQTKIPFVLALANDGPLLEPMQQKAAALCLGDTVRFLGFRTDVKNMLYSCDIYVNASEHEALSFNLVEAMAAGRPLVATDMAGNGDVVNEKTDCGILVQYNNPASMAAALARLLEDDALRAQYAENALKAAAQYFNLDITAAQTLAVYQ